MTFFFISVPFLFPFQVLQAMPSTGYEFVSTSGTVAQNAHNEVVWWQVVVAGCSGRLWLYFRFF